MTSTAQSPPVVHVTHWKAGSQWVRSVLAHMFPDRIVEPQVANEHVTKHPIERGRIYPTVYMDRLAFEQIGAPDDCAVFFVVRDLRDTVVSSYFSQLKSHPLVDPSGRPHPGLAETRAALRARSKEEGLLHLVETTLESTAAIQSSWLDASVPVFRFEDLVVDERGQFAAILDVCGLPRDQPSFESALSTHSFETVTGRRRGVEDTSSHLRKGAPGDWRNHFTDAVKAAFAERYGDLLIRAGYETGTSW
ncbi:MAG: sulfotransferase domain-containing protein [Planctomycetota bacterium]